MARQWLLSQCFPDDSPSEVENGNPAVRDPKFLWHLWQESANILAAAQMLVYLFRARS